VSAARLEPPDNPRGGRTLIVDGSDPNGFPRPSAALQEAGPDDQIYVRPGRYEDKLFIAGRPIRLIGAGRDAVEIYNRRTGPIYLQQVAEGLITGITFRYFGSDQHSALNLLDSSCTVSGCRVMDGLLSGAVIYGPEARPTFVDNEVLNNRESGIFVFAGARPYVARNLCAGNHHFGLAVRDPDTQPELVRNVCRDNRLSGILLFHLAQAMLLENDCHANHDWGVVLTPDCKTVPELDALRENNRLDDNPRGAVCVTETPLAPIGR
jgi:hypothetical protein